MTYQEKDVCCRCKFNCCCADKAIRFFALLLVFAVGLILGTIFAPVLRYALAALIAFAAAIAASLIALLIYRWCECRCMRRGE